MQLQEEEGTKVAVRSSSSNAAALHLQDNAFAKVSSQEGVQRERGQAKRRRPKAMRWCQSSSSTSTSSTPPLTEAMRRHHLSTSRMLK